MALWTDVIDPATLTGYARASLEEYEQSKGSLSAYLPDQIVNDIVVRVVAGQNGLVEAAKFRAYDAEIEPGANPGGARKVLELPALGQYVPVSEYDQLRIRNASDDEMLISIQKATDAVVAAVADRMEQMRGIVLATGKATINEGQNRFQTEDDFGRDADMAVTAPVLWSDAAADPLTDLAAFVDAYEARNGEMPGTLVVSNRIARAIAASKPFQTVLAGGGNRPASITDVQTTLDGYNIPQLVTYSRKIRVGGVSTNVLPDDSIFLLPAAGQSALGATYWGRTLTSTELSWGIPNADQAGIVAGVYRNEKPPVIAEVFGDAIGLPVLANANLAFTAKVL